MERWMNDDWRTQAACKGVDPDLFFPTRGAGGFTDIREAKKVCDTCPVQPECLEYALVSGETVGVWGGMSERQRKRIRSARSLRQSRPRPRPECGTNSGYRYHYRQNEKACFECTRAHTLYHAERRDRQQEAG